MLLTTLMMLMTTLMMLITTMLMKMKIAKLDGGRRFKAAHWRLQPDKDGKLRSNKSDDSITDDDIDDDDDDEETNTDANGE